MPEALAIVLVFAASVIAFVGGSLQSRRPVTDHAAERGRALAQHEWLTQRLVMARRENWDARMIAEIERQLDATATELRNLAARS